MKIIEASAHGESIGIVLGPTDLKLCDHFKFEGWIQVFCITEITSVNYYTYGHLESRVKFIALVPGVSDAPAKTLNIEFSDTFTLNYKPLEVPWASYP